MSDPILAVESDIDPLWIPCRSCDEYWCVKHEKHVFECDCPPIEEWVEKGTNPYG